MNIQNPYSHAKNGSQPKIVPMYRALNDGLRIAVKICFAKDVVQTFREFGATWNSSAKQWILQVQDAEKLLAFAKKAFPYEKYHTASFVAKMKTALANPLKFGLSEHLETTILPVADGKARFLAVFLPYDKPLLRGIKSLGGFSWVDNGKYWKTYTTKSSEIRNMLWRFGVNEDDVYVHKRWLSENQLFEWQCYKPTVSVGKSAPIYGPDGQVIPAIEPSLEQFFIPMEQYSLDENAIVAATHRFGLYEYQPDGVRHLLATSGALLGDDMGLGKTRQAIVAAILAKAPTDGQVLVVCPASLRSNWTREIEKVCGEPSWVVGRQEDGAGAKWWISSYESMGKVLATSAKFEAMIIDEAHFVKEMSANRTKRALEIGARSKHRMLLTGTPVLNDYKELFPLLAISGHPLAGMGLAKFGKIFKQKRGHQELAKQISKWMLRRTKDQVLSLGEKKEIQKEIDIPLEFRHAYNLIFDDQETAALVKIQRLRKIIEDAKISFISENIKELDSTDKALIFFQYKDSVRQMLEVLKENKIKTCQITGDLTATKRVEAEDKFQSDDKIKVCVATIDAAYAGLNLTAANYVFHGTLPWTPAKKRQAEDRAYRNGQTKNVIVMTPIAVDTIDEQLLDLLQYKTTMAHDSTEVDEENVVNDLAEKLFKEKPKLKTGTQSIGMKL